jgi:GPH family glycoside/pentoside/hexuronide:cation symporter
MGFWPPDPHVKQFLNRWLFGLGGIANNAMPNAPVVMLLPIYNIGLGLNPALIGVAMAIPRIWEIFLDPWVGVVSDRSTLKMGRRRPYIIGGSIMAGLLFAAIWWVPPGWGSAGHAAWLIITMLLYFTAFSFFFIPYSAFGIETVRGDEPERLRLMGAVNSLANFAGVPMGWLFWCCQLSCFANPVQGMRWVGLVFGVIIGACALTPALVRQESPRVTIAEDGKKIALAVPRVKLRDVLKFRPLLHLVVCYFALIFCFATVSQQGMYVLIYKGCAGDTKLASLIGGISATLQGVLGAFAAPLVAALGERFGRRHVLMPFLAVGALGSLSMWWTVTPKNPYLVLVSGFAIGFCIASFWTIIPALLGTISDDFERQTGQACQGMISAVAGISGKLAVSAAFLLTGVMVNLCGFDVKAPLSTMGPALTRMTLIYALLPSVGIFIAGWSAWTCPVSTGPHGHPHPGGPAPQ